MKAEFAIFLLLTFAAVSGREEETAESSESNSEVESEESNEEGRDMSFCLNQENVTEAEMKSFLTSKGLQKVKESLKKAILCFLTRIEFFNGSTWNLTVIAESVGENSRMLKSIKECLKRDDGKLEPQERTYRVQKCVLEVENPK